MCFGLQTTFNQCKQLIYILYSFVSTEFSRKFLWLTSLQNSPVRFSSKNNSLSLINHFYSDSDSPLFAPEDTAPPTAPASPLLAPLSIRYSGLYNIHIRPPDCFNITHKVADGDSGSPIWYFIWLHCITEFLIIKPAEIFSAILGDTLHDIHNPVANPDWVNIPPY